MNPPRAGRRCGQPNGPFGSAPIIGRSGACHIGRHRKRATEETPMATRTPALASATAEPGLRRYLAQIRQFPMLTPEEEYVLAKRWREHGDRAAAQQLVTSHLRLAA